MVESRVTLVLPQILNVPPYLTSVAWTGEPQIKLHQLDSNVVTMVTAPAPSSSQAMNTMDIARVLEPRLV